MSSINIQAPGTETIREDDFVARMEQAEKLDETAAKEVVRNVVFALIAISVITLVGVYNMALAVFVMVPAVILFIAGRTDRKWAAEESQQS